MSVLGILLIMFTCLTTAPIILGAAKVFLDLPDYLDYRRYKNGNSNGYSISGSNIIYAIENSGIELPKRRTPLQKEIREEERQIEELKRQKADMERLAALQAEREALFEEVDEVSRDDLVDERVRVAPFERGPLLYSDSIKAGDHRSLVQKVEDYNREADEVIEYCEGVLKQAKQDVTEAKKRVEEEVEEEMVKRAERKAGEAAKEAVDFKIKHSQRMKEALNIAGEMEWHCPYCGNKGQPHIHFDPFAGMAEATCPGCRLTYPTSKV